MDNDRHSTSEVVTKYLESNYTISQVPISQRNDRKGAGQIKFESLVLRDEVNKQLDFATTGDNLHFHLKFSILEIKATQKVPLEIGIIIRDNQGSIVTTLASFFTDESPKGVDNNHEIICNVPKFPLLAGQYYIDLWCATSSETQDWLENAITLQVESGNYFNSAHAWLPRSVRHGKMIIEQKWYS